MSSLALTTRHDLGLLLLRTGLSGMWLSHGLLLKLLTFGAGGLSAWLIGIGLPGALAWPLILAEALGGTLILLGLAGRWVSLALLPLLLGATWVHAGNGWVFSSPGGGWEYPLLLAIVSMVHVLLGDGRLAVQR